MASTRPDNVSSKLCMILAARSLESTGPGTEVRVKIVDSRHWRRKARSLVEGVPVADGTLSLKTTNRQKCLT